MIGFADDLALVAFSKDSLVLESKINNEFTSIDTWMSSKGLKVAPTKSEAIIFSGKRVFPQLNIFMKG